MILGDEAAATGFGSHHCRVGRRWARHGSAMAEDWWAQLGGLRNLTALLADCIMVTIAP